jgi:hypothetical protein
MGDVHDRIARLSPEQREVLQRLLRKKGVGVPMPGIRPRTGAAAEVPLSFAQRRLWFLDQMEPGNSFYNVVDSIVFDEAVDPVLVERSLNEVVRRHETLRTTFAQRQHEPVQVIASHVDLALDVRDLDAVEPVARALTETEWSTAFAEQPFDLSRGPLLRAMLIRTEGDGCELMLCMHHIISDAWSLEVLEREVRAILTAFAHDQPSPLKPLPVQYADFALWQRDHLTGGILNEQLQFWTRALTGAPPVIDLPIARPRPPVPTYRGAAQSRTIPTGVAQALRTLGRREGATLFMNNPGRLQRAAGPLHRSRRPRRRHPRGGEGPGRDGAADWVLRQYAGDPHGPVRRPYDRGADPSHA